MAESMVDELMPCPWCGKRLTKENIDEWNGMYQLIHECDDLSIEVKTRLYYDKRSVIDTWNGRVC